MSVDNTPTVWLLSRDLFQSLTRRTNVVLQLYRLRYAEFKPTKTMLDRDSSCPASSCSNTLSTVTKTVTGLQLHLLSGSSFLSTGVHSPHFHYSGHVPRDIISLYIQVRGEVTSSATLRRTFVIRGRDLQLCVGLTFLRLLTLLSDGLGGSQTHCQTIYFRFFSHKGGQRQGLY